MRRGWSFVNPDTVEQCVSEGWTDKIKEQAEEGCNIAGMVHVNKVIGEFFLVRVACFDRGGSALTARELTRPL